MDTIKIIIVEDEVLIAETIRLYLESRNHIILDICISFDEAVNSINIKTPDLLLVDIRLYGEKSGVDLANYLSNHSFNIPIVYLTSQFDQKIMQSALATNPYGYLTKPVQKETLWTTVESAYSLFKTNNTSLNTINLSDGKQTFSVDTEKVLYIKVERVYSEVYIEDGHQIMTRKPLGAIVEEIDDPNFLQCHRSYAVNVRKIQSWNNSEVMIDGKKIPMSRTKKDDILAILNKM